ncbi:hypothetical protein [Mycobacterium sp. 1245111.1]|uniref:hypothetical protein n=1 Tax=Mycobacterium sp. 1245111.1 TaxID=1834073 RepID=UPI000ADF4D68|nr:hypothetical protein [Mycobacterium sp. 1245111.1]
MTTSIPEARLVELRREGNAQVQRFVDPDVIARCIEVLDRRGELWAAAVLGRDLVRRSLIRAGRPYLRAGEDYTLVAADRVETDCVAEVIWKAGQ